MSKNLDVEILTIDKILPHPNADKLEIIQFKGYQAIFTKDTLKVGETVLYIKSDAQIDLETEWSKDIQKFLSSTGRVKTVKLRNEFSEGIIISKKQIEEFYSWTELIQLSNEELANVLKIKHYEAPMQGNGDMEIKGILPYELPPTDQENVQSIEPETILGKRYLITRKKDGSSCTMTFHKIENDEFEVDVTSRSVNLKLDKDNIYTVAARPIIDRVMQFLKAFPDFLPLDGILVLRGELCGVGIQNKSINIDAKGDKAIHIFEAFIQNKPGLLSYHSRKYLPIVFDEHNSKYCLADFPEISFVPMLKIINFLTEEHINFYLKAPVSDGEGVVLWEIEDNEMANDCIIKPTGWSFKIRSKEYDAKM